MSAKSLTEMTYEEHFYDLFGLTCGSFLVKKEHIDEMRQNPKIVELVVLTFFEAYEKSNDKWAADFMQTLLNKCCHLTGKTPMLMEISCHFSEALIRIYEQGDNEQKKAEAKELYKLSMQKRDECDPIVTFQNKPIRYSKISKHDHQPWDYEKLQRGFDAFNGSLRADRLRAERTEKKSETDPVDEKKTKEEQPLDPEAQRLADKKERNRKTRENKKNEKMMSQERAQDNSTDNSEIPRSSLQNTPTSSESPGSSESKISEMVKKLMDFEI